ncbi:Fic family protein [Xylanibacter ruminicola]|uniref:Fic family protein n=1 Tax=Xylanibacter ruminicola TaxID=839 RepID=A0A1H5S5S9_XYLRU|nr:Fic family protein [Xylanibacter ruminicola]SEF45167.1 Fic family protein [Xylanibacter ruminicola]
MIELPPKIDRKTIVNALLKESNEEIAQLVDAINSNYEYWDKVKYKSLPEGFTPQMLWAHVKASRLRGMITVWEKYDINLCITSKMLRMCHEFDMKFGSFWETDNDAQSPEKKYYLSSSLMEEAIYSSKMEGASTTRVVAKEMLRKKKSPQNKAQQMIVNNYSTIRYIVEHKDEPLTEESLLYVHKLMTENTLDDPADAGRFRTNDKVVVADMIEGDIVYTPPTYKDIPDFVKTICDFFNNSNPRTFIHPIIKGIIIHFMVAYMHPFVDGNGRTARALFYWYMLKENYKLTEYMSISRVISKSKASYEKAFRYTENDGNDMGYFVAYNLKALEISFQQLREYIQRKQQEKKAANTFMMAGNINYRQAMVLQRLTEEPDAILTVRDVQEQFSVSSMTARKDLTDLVQQGYLTEVAINKVTRGYIKMQEG